MSILAATGQSEDVGGLTGFALDVVDRMGEIGIGLLVVLETVFPPIPSEVILPLGGYLAHQGRLSLIGILIIATVGSLVGALVLYYLGAAFGRRRATATLARLPLVDAEDVDRAFDWFQRHGNRAVFFGRLVPGVRSLVSIPAGTAHMPVLTFSLLTVAGSAIWNTLLILGGYALGTQYHVVEQYTAYLDAVFYALIAGALVWLVYRQVRKRAKASS